MDDDETDILCRKFFERGFERFGRTLQVRFDDDTEFFDVARVDRLVKIFERNFFDRARFFEAFQFLPFYRNFARVFFAFRHLERIARIRHTFNAEHFDGHGRRGFLNAFSAIVEHGPHVT